MVYNIHIYYDGILNAVRTGYDYEKSYDHKWAKP